MLFEFGGILIQGDKNPDKKTGGTEMKKIAVAILSASLIFSASSAAYAAVPVEKKHEHNTHREKAHMKKMHTRSKQEHRLHAKSDTHKLHAKSLHSKSLRAKEITEMPKTGFGGASEQTE
ncbi:hypothetical protein ACFQBN_35015 [Cohnella cellulosilytica]